MRIANGRHGFIPNSHVNAGPSAVTELLRYAAIAGDGHSWKLDGVCAQVDPTLFYVNPSESVAPAKLVCAQCPVREQCLEEALRLDDEHGVWGGLTPRERRALKEAPDAA